MFPAEDAHCSGIAMTLSDVICHFKQEGMMFNHAGSFSNCKAVLVPFELMFPNVTSRREDRRLSVFMIRAGPRVSAENGDLVSV